MKSNPSISDDLKACACCGIERDVTTLDAQGRCPFCQDKEVPPKHPKIVVKPRKEPKKPKIVPPTPTEPVETAQKGTKIPKALRPEDQAAVDEAFAIPYTPPVFDRAEAENNPQKELAMRELARRRFLPFVQRFRPKYLAGWVHRDVCRRLERFLERVENREEPRLLMMMPPRSGKSELGSRHFPPWALGKHPDWEIIAASHTSSLTLSFSRYIRDLVKDPAYQVLFENMRLDPSSQSVENWNTLNGGGYLAAGVGTGITGRGAHILLLDDLVKDIEAADSPTIRENTWEWYISTAYTRLAPGGGVLGIMCMTGETPVMMADGTWRRLDSLRPSDAIATYACGLLGATRVAAVRSSGRDSVFKITTTSGKIVRANHRHPFLTVTPAGEVSWTRLKNLTTAHRIVTVKDSGVSGEASPVLPRDATSLRDVVVFATATTASSGGRRGTGLEATTTPPDATPDSSTVTGSPLPSTTQCTRPKKAVARSAVNRQKQGIRRDTGRTNWPLITTMPAGRFADCSATTATTATPESDTLELSRWHYPPQGISDFTLDELVSIEPDGEEEVFDVQVNCTENFIANGLVSHNTWWNEDDWAGKIQQVMKSGEGDKFEIIRYPAINEEGDEYLLPDDQIIQILPGSTVPVGAKMTRPKGTAIHPERYSTQAMTRIKNNLVAAGQKRIWNALYQQNPTPDDGVYFTKEMYRYYVHAPQRRNMTIYQAWDFAITEETQNDYTVCATIGQDEYDNLYVLHIMRFRSNDGNAIVEHMIDQHVAYDVDFLGVEDGQIWKTLRAQFEKRCQERRVYPSFEVLQPLTDKLVRANPLKGRMQLGKVFFLKGADWEAACNRELMVFPAGKHDDQVDALAWATRLTLNHAPPKPPAPPPQKSWKDKLKGLTNGKGTSHMAA